MKKKKIIISSIFLTLIAITSFLFIKGAFDSYNYDTDPANGVDIMEGMGAAMFIVLGGLVILYELDLFYTVYYFFIKPKTVAKSILNIFSNLSLLLVFFCEYYKDIFKEDFIALLIVVSTYAVLRAVYFLILVFRNSKETDIA